MFATVKGGAAAQHPHAPGSATWWRQRYDRTETRRRGRAGGLSLAKITEATLEIVEREGLDAVTMRRIAEELATGPASLYRHVASREELLVVVTDEVFQGVQAPVDDRLGWRERSERTARNARAFLLARPAVIPLVARAQLLGPNSLRGRERVLGPLLADGFSPALAVRTYLTLTHYVIGSVNVHSRSAKQDADERRALVALFRSLDADEYPTIVALADDLGGLRPEDEFEFGLQALLDGIAAARQRDRMTVHNQRRRRPTARRTT